MFGFIRKLFIAMAIVAGLVAPARADIATVAGVNEYITQRWDITMPATSARGVLDMSRLMQLIDTANTKLNGTATSDYAHDTEYATHKIVATNAATNAVDTLISRKLYDPKFWFEPAVEGDTFEFYISAQGNYTIYWGDGEIESIYRDNTTGKTYSHTYEDGKPASEHTIGLGGESFAYSTSTATPVISFNAAARRIKSFDGCLGCIFPTIDDGGEGKQPRFYNTFANNTTLGGEIPADLFKGIRGKAVHSIFKQTFSGCKGLTGKIPDGLFGKLTSAANDIFMQTFYNCTGLTGFGDKMFGSITGGAALNMFNQTFFGCSGLTDKIPDGLFGGFTGNAAGYMFYGTFSGCSSLSGTIPSGLFGSMSGNAAGNMFRETFYNCSGLTGKIPDGLFGNFTGNAAGDMFNQTFAGCKGLTELGDKMFGSFTGNAAQSMFNKTFYNCSGLTGKIPDGLFGNFTGNAALTMFYGTFSGCSSLSGTIPSGLFGSMSGNAAGDMFYQTFLNCSSLTGKIPDGLFGGFSGNAANNMFYQTFYNCRGLIGLGDNMFGNFVNLTATMGIFYQTFFGCTGLTGKIPDGIFGGVSGVPSVGMFTGTFDGCTGLTAIGDNLFGDINGAEATNMFYQTFNGCTSLTGPSATVGTGDDKQYLYQRWPDATTAQVSSCYTNDTELDDYDCIPTVWGGAGTQEPGTCNVPPAEPDADE